MIRYAHVGLPKCASTWLQCEFFPQHPQLLHLGKNNGDRIDSDAMRLFLHADVIDTPAYLYDAEAARALFDEAHRRATANDRTRAFGISMEGLTGAVLGRLDLDERARRVVAAMGDETRIVMLVRDPAEWIRSLYATFVREGGLTASFEEWTYHFVYERDVSPYANLLYDRI